MKNESNAKMNPVILDILKKIESKKKKSKQSQMASRLTSGLHSGSEDEDYINRTVSEIPKRKSSLA